MNEQDSSKLRGRSAIEAVHVGVTGEDEGRLDATISRFTASKETRLQRYTPTTT